MKITSILKKSIVRNTTTVLAGNIIAQVISLVIYPLLTRLYSPDDFGVLTIFLSIGGMVTILSTADYHNAIVLPKDRQEGASLLHIGLIITICITVLCILTIPFGSQIASLFGNDAVGAVYPLIPLYVFGTALWTLLQNWFIREKEFLRISSYQVTQSVINAGAKGWLGTLGVHAGMVITMAVAPIVALAGCMFKGFRHTLAPLMSFNWQECKRVAIRHIDFPKYSMPRSLINYFSGALPVFILSPYFSTADIGIYSIALTLAFKPINLITNSLHNVLFQRFSESVANKNKIMPLLKKITAFILLSAVVVFIPLYIVLPDLTSWLLGDEWREAGEYIRLMLPWLAFLSLVSTTHFLPYLFGKQKGQLIFETSYTVVRLSVLAIGVMLDNFYYALALFFISSAVIMMAQYVWMYSIAAKYEKSL